MERRLSEPPDGFEAQARSEPILTQVANVLSGGRWRVDGELELFSGLSAAMGSRGGYDVRAVAACMHCPSTHRREAPLDAAELEQFVCLERARIMAIAGLKYRGVKINLESELAQSLKMERMWMQFLLGECISPPSKEANPPHEDDRQLLRSHIYNQAEFARVARRLCEREDGPFELPVDAFLPPSPSQLSPLPSPMTPSSVPRTHTPHQAGPVETSSSASPAAYRVYTSDFDEEVDAAGLATLNEQRQLRAEFDRFVRDWPWPSAHRWAHQLKKKLSARALPRWQFEQDEGLLDGRRLSQFIINPRFKTIFKRAHLSTSPKAVVTVLLDSSASMQGTPMMLSLWTIELLVRALEYSQIKVEVLGYTTKDWKGGEVYKLWQSNGCPPRPGRLNALRHIVYKAADTPWRLSRFSLTTALQPGLLKENIDGEALDWATQRLRRRPEGRKILLVVSDGAPADRTTQLANGRRLLAAHLQTVVQRIERRSDIELVAIGMGHNVQRTYSRSICIRSPDELGGALGQAMHQLFDL